jgi:hypothetical protein
MHGENGLVTRRCSAAIRYDRRTADLPAEKGAYARHDFVELRLRQLGEYGQ